MDLQDISVAICDDSALMRNLISRVIDETEGLSVAGKAGNGQILVNNLSLYKPDVIVLDIEMPTMTGVEFLKWRKQNKVDIPVIILSSIAEKGAAVTIECLELGAADFITKHARRHGKQVRSSDFFSNLGSDRLVERKLASKMGVEKAKEFLSSTVSKPSVTPSILSTPASSKGPAVIEPLRKPGKIEVIAIGISTGGPNALRDVFKMIDPHLKQPVLVVQHMPAGFTKEFANSLNKICALNVKEAEDNEPIESGNIYIAPGNYHIYVEQTALGKKMLRLSQEPQRNGHRPSADVLFESVAKVYQNHALGVIMTGMGKDGAVELAEMRKQGAWTLGQDEATAIVYGMPKVAFELGGVQKQVPLDKMADEISKLARENS